MERFSVVGRVCHGALCEDPNGLLLMVCMLAALTLRITNRLGEHGIRIGSFSQDINSHAITSYFSS